MASLEIEINGITFLNPFVIGSGPPSTNARVISRCFDAGWGGVVAKTCSLDSTQVVNVRPRYGKLKKLDTNQVIGFENIELISDRPFETWLEEFRQLKVQYPNHVLIASIMEEYRKENWQEITRRVQETGVDMLELNLSCPHGHPERKMGAAMGQNPDIVEEVVGWVKEVSTIPVWAKMTPNVTNVAIPAEASFEAGADGVSVINTILSVIGVDLKTLRPLPTVQGFSTPGGYSYLAVKPQALKMVSDIARALPGKEISGIGGVTQSNDAIEFMLLGSSSVQVCTAVMLQGHEMIHELLEGTKKFMIDHNFERPRDFVGHSLPYLTTHHHLVERLMEAKAIAKGKASRDSEWGTEDIVTMTSELTSNE